MSKDYLISEMRKEAQEPTSPAQNTGNLSEAIKAVYRRYGNDLPAFFRDAYKETARRHQEAPDNCTEVNSV